MQARLAAALVVALLLRLGFGLLYWVDKPLTHDEREYLLLARNIAEGQGFGYPPGAPSEGERFGRAPLYPAFLAAVMAITGATRSETGPGAPNSSLLRSIRIAQALVGVAGVWLIGALAGAAVGPSARAIAMWMAAIYPPLVWICAYVLSEALYSTLALGSALLLSRAIDTRGESESPEPERGRSAIVALAGVLAGLSALTRPAALFFIAVAGVWMLWRGPLRWALVFAAGAALAIGPWTVRNVREYHMFVLIASEGGVTFWTGNHPLAGGEGDLAANPDIKRANVEFRRAHPGLTEEALEKLYYRDALGYIATHPFAWAVLTVKKLFYLWIPIGPSYRLHSARYYWTSVVSYGVLLPLALAGAARVARGRAQPHAMWLLAASAILMCLVFFPQERFRIPVIDPVLIVCAAARLVR